jgi:hypothetical protein
MEVTGAFLATCCLEAKMYPGAIYRYLGPDRCWEYIFCIAEFVEEEVEDFSF